MEKTPADIGGYHRPGWTVGKTYAQIWEAFSAKHGDTAETRRIHGKWKQLAATS